MPHKPVWWRDAAYQATIFAFGVLVLLMLAALLNQPAMAGAEREKATALTTQVVELQRTTSALRSDNSRLNLTAIASRH